jgi:EamA-like transporter family
MVPQYRSRSIKLSESLAPTTDDWQRHRRSPILTLVNISRRRSTMSTGLAPVQIKPARTRARTARTAVAALVAAAGCWGTGTVASKQVVDDVAPLTLLPVQLAVSCAFLLVVALARREPLIWTPPVRRLAALGVLNPGIAYALGLIGLTTITASMSVLLWALGPVSKSGLACR